MAGHSGGPWGGGQSGGGGNRGNNGGGGGRKPPEGGGLPEIDDLVRKGQDQLRVLMGGKGGGNGTRGPRGGAGGPGFSRGTVGLGVLAVIGLWAFSSFYTVKPEEQGVELFLGEYSNTTGPGLNFAPWPLVTAEVIAVTREQSENIGVGPRGSEANLMLTGDENIVDIDFSSSSSVC